MEKINQKLLVLLILIAFSLVISSTRGTKNLQDSFITSTNKVSDILNPEFHILSDYISHTDIPRTNFTGTYNVTLFTNPDNADEVIFRYLKAAKSSIFVSMYTISRPEFNETLIDLKTANPSIDIQVLISYRRVGSIENADTEAAAQSLEENGIPVYTSTQDDDKVDGFYHAKYWIIDGKHVFVYSGNWSPRSVTPQLEPGDDSYSSGEANRDMGIAVHDAPEIASFIKEEVWDEDVAVADEWTSSTIKQKSAGNALSNPSFKITVPNLYYPTFDALNVKDKMTLSPMFTPDNALDFHKWWIDRANDTIKIQNPYITQFDDDVSWSNDPSPLVRSLIEAKNRGVSIRVQVNEDSDSDDVTAYFLGKGIEVKWMGNKETSTEGWLSDTHNKLIIIDDKVTLLSSINFGIDGFTKNREAGMVIQSTKVSDYYSSIFQTDWADGEIPPSSPYTEESSSGESTGLETSFFWSPIIIVLVLLPITRRRLR
ncbi:MAG: phosphatidylserine/phosphatidylglycerophosphate/cardiolipin synthase family protein [Candidatus Hodarchaeota archaeon]